MDNSDYIQLLSTDSETEDINDYLGVATTKDVFLEKMEDQIHFNKNQLNKLQTVINKAYSLQFLFRTRIKKIDQLKNSYKLSESSHELSTNVKKLATEINKMPDEIHNGQVFKPSNGNAWCFVCFTLAAGDDSEIVIHETFCEHYICSDCISAEIRKCARSLENFKCPHCKKILLKMF
jgi:hypothetical protein